MFQLSKEEWAILGVIGLGLTGAVYMYAQKKGREEGLKKVDELKAIINSSLTIDEKRSKVSETLNEMK